MPLRRIETTAERIAREKEHSSKALVDERNRLNRWARVFGTEDGILVLDELLDRCGVLDKIFETNSRIYANAGRQELGTEIVSDILKADADIYHRLVDMWVAQMAAREAEAIKNRAKE